MDELQSIGVGIALGLALVSFLSFFPGEPFDYSADTCETRTIDSHSFTPPTTGPASSSAEATPVHSAHTKQQQIAELEQAAQRVKIQKLQEMLGLEKAKAQELVQRAKRQAVSAVEKNTASNTNSKSQWLDRFFLTSMFGLLTWILWQDYSINILSVAAHILPREAEVIRQIVATSQSLLAQIGLWQ